MKKFHFAACGLALALAGCNNTNSTSPSASAPTTDDASRPTITVIPKGTTHSYWKSVQAGASKAGKEVGANIVFKGPVQESDRAGQIGIVQQFVSDGVGAIVLAPLDDVALVKPVKSAAAKKIPVVIIDSALKGTPGTDFASFVATDNTQGGVLADEKLISLLKGKGKVVLLRYQEGSSSTGDRETGFLSALKKAPGITIVFNNTFTHPKSHLPSEHEAIPPLVVWLFRRAGRNARLSRRWSVRPSFARSRYPLQHRADRK